MATRLGDAKIAITLDTGTAERQLERLEKSVRKSEGTQDQVEKVQEEKEKEDERRVDDAKRETNRAAVKFGFKIPDLEGIARLSPVLPGALALGVRLRTLGPAAGAFVSGLLPEEIPGLKEAIDNGILLATKVFGDRLDDIDATLKGITPLIDQVTQILLAQTLLGDGPDVEGTAKLARALGVFIVREIRLPMQSKKVYWETIGRNAGTIAQEALKSAQSRGN